MREGFLINNVYSLFWFTVFLLVPFWVGWADTPCVCICKLVSVCPMMEKAGGMKAKKNVWAYI